MTLLAEKIDYFDELSLKIQTDGFNSSLADQFIEDLWQLKQIVPDEWDDYVKLLKDHPLCVLLRECPIIKHSYLRPRGYPGDAELIDYFYLGVNADYKMPGNTTQLGNEVFKWFVESIGGKSLRQRRDFISDEIKTICQEKTKPKILSIAAGHARELLPFAAHLKSSHLSFTALDQDRNSLRCIMEYLPFPSVQLINHSVIDILTGKIFNEQYDFIYSMGLYDYLPDSTTERLTQYLHANLLAPEGTLLIANYSPELKFSAFMELVMNWKLIYRDQHQVHRFTSRIDQVDLGEVNINSISDGLIWVLKTKKPCTQ